MTHGDKKKELEDLPIPPKGYKGLLRRAGFLFDEPRTERNPETDIRIPPKGYDRLHKRAGIPLPSTEHTSTDNQKHKLPVREPDFW